MMHGVAVNRYSVNITGGFTGLAPDQVGTHETAELHSQHSLTNQVEAGIHIVALNNCTQNHIRDTTAYKLCLNQSSQHKKDQL
jgi:hypothetical protein